MYCVYMYVQGEALKTGHLNISTVIEDREGSVRLNLDGVEGIYIKLRPPRHHLV